MLIETVSVNNFRSISHLDQLALRPINVFFGPNGSGKSTFLDALWFLRDCAIRGATAAANSRSHGIGLVWNGADPQTPIEIEIATKSVRYKVSIVVDPGVPDIFPGEALWRTDIGAGAAANPIRRKPRSVSVEMYNGVVQSTLPVPLRDPDKLSLGLYLDFNADDKVSSDLDYALRNLRQHSSRSFFLHGIKTQGVESQAGVMRLADRAENLWSVLRNLNDRRDIDERFDTILRYMRQAFPAFSALSIEQTGPESLSARFQEKHLSRPMSVSGMSDGHLQMLILLTAIFAEGRRPTLVMFDEPDLSLNPWALQVLAEALQEAADHWHSQFIIATHSPVLLSMFNEADLIVSRNDGQALYERLVDQENVKVLLDQYAAGSLYMMQLIGEQAEPMVHEVDAHP